MRELVFLIGRRTGHYGSAFMRARQLKELLAPVLRATGMTCRVAAAGDGMQHSAVVLHKTFLQESRAPAELVAELKNANNFVIADPLDIHSGRLNALSSCDCIIASSVAQRNGLIARFPTTKVAYVPHHVDLRIAEVACQKTQFACAYVGIPENGLHVDFLMREGICDIVVVKNPNRTGWIRALPKYNCHYIARRWREWDGYKPFVKGFTAAHCGAVVVAQRGDAEAELLLGSAYPFLYEIASAAQAREAVEDAKASFGGAKWRIAESIMNDLAWHSSAERTRLEFARILRAGMARESELLAPTSTHARPLTPAAPIPAAELAATARPARPHAEPAYGWLHSFLRGRGSR